MEEQPYKAFEEWQLQAEYDLETAESLFQSGRLIYTVFFCHLSVEKMLKALWTKKFEKVPPKTHDLEFLLKRLQINPVPDPTLNFVFDLNAFSVPTRYPESLKAMSKIFTKEKTQDVFNQTKAIIKWLKKM